MPCVVLVNRVSPAVWLTVQASSADERSAGPGVGDQNSPVSSSRRYSASEVGSATGSFANGVSRFSRLLPDHVCADPEAVTIVPNPGLAMTLDQGSGVSPEPVSVIA